MKSTMTIGKKLTLTVGSLLLVLAVVGGVSIYNLASLNQATQATVTDPMPGMATVASERAAMLQIRGDMWRHVAMADPTVRAELERDIESAKSTLVAGLDSYEKTITTPEDRALFGKVKEEWQRYSEGYPRVVELSRQGKSAEAAALEHRDVSPVFNEGYPGSPL